MRGAGGWLWVVVMMGRDEGVVVVAMGLMRVPSGDVGVGEVAMLCFLCSGE